MSPALYSHYGGAAIVICMSRVTWPYLHWRKTNDETWCGCLIRSSVADALILDCDCGASGLVRVAWFLLP